jgi:drug/metabolite transporter (DMT)-like permease
MSPLLTGGALAFSVLCMSASSILIRLGSAPVLVTAFYRLVFTAVLAALLRRYFKESGPALPPSSAKYILPAGLFLALHFALWFTSLDYTSVSSSVLFTNQQVLFVLLFSAFGLREKLPRAAGLGVVLALAGCVAVAGGDVLKGGLWGDFLALVSGLCVAIYYIAGRVARRKMDTWTYTMAVALVAAVLLLPAVAVSGADWLAYSARDWLIFVLLALLPGIAGHGILNWSLKYVKAPLVSLSILGETVGASILALLIFQERLAGYQMLGGLMILSGIALALVRGSEKEGEI